MAQRLRGLAADLAGAFLAGADFAVEDFAAGDFAAGALRAGALSAAFPAALRAVDLAEVFFAAVFFAALASRSAVFTALLRRRDGCCSVFFDAGAGALASGCAGLAAPRR